MNRKSRILISISAAKILLVSAVAQVTTGAKIGGPDTRAIPPQSVRDNAAGTLTPFELDARNADLAITARIRAEIVVGKDLSVNARNVKITTTGGRVVLRGAVTTAAEKRLIGDIAIRIQRRENVDNQLVVKLPPSAPTGLSVVP